MKENFSQEELKLFETAFEARNDTQYYINREVTNEDYEKIIRQAHVFLVKCKNIHFHEGTIEKFEMVTAGQTSLDNFASFLCFAKFSVKFVQTS